MLYIFGKQTGGNVGDYCFPEPRAECQIYSCCIRISRFEFYSKGQNNKILLSLIHEKFYLEC